MVICKWVFGWAFEVIVGHNYIMKEILSIEDRYEIAYEYYDDEDYKKVYSLFLELAIEGDKDSQMVIASMLCSGTKINKNLDEAYYWYKKAADNGEVEACYIYAYYCLEEGQNEEGTIYLQKAVDENHIDAIYNMAIYTLNGMYNFDKDEEKAIALFKKSALLDDMESYAQIWMIQSNKLGKKKAWKYIRHEFGFSPIWRIHKICLLNYLKKIMKIDTKQGN